MSRIECKITEHMNNQENLNLDGKRQPTDTNVEIIQSLEVSDKDFTAAMMSML